MASTAPDQPDFGIEEVDVLVVGAGISGVASARQITRDHPGLTLAVLESRDRIGGTWDLFRYPGIRSDSAMGTFAYSFRPWPGSRTFGRGPEIRTYLEETADAAGVSPLIRFGHRVTAASWDSSTGRWTVSGNGPEGEFRIRCRFLLGATGYFNYEHGHSPTLAGEENFTGELFHAQDWPENLEVNGRRIVVIGSGATAITVVPALAEAGAEVTMLQRSPSYVVAVPDRPAWADLVKRCLPHGWSKRLLRWSSLIIEIAQFQLARRFPNLARRVVIKAARRQLPSNFEKRHFIPRYNPWDQRLCFSPDGDLFTALSSGKARIATGEIERIEAEGIRLKDGTRIETDVIVKATGLELQLFGGITLDLDGESVDPAERLIYRGTMISGIRNFIFTIGYTNASWTLKAELAARFASQVIAATLKRGATAVAPVPPAGPMETVPLLNLDSGYIRRAEALLPKVGDRSPWRLHMNYLADRRELLRADLEDGSLEYS